MSSGSEDSSTPPMPALGRTRSTPVRTSAIAASAGIHEQSTAGSRRALSHQLLPSQRKGGKPPTAPTSNKNKTAASKKKTTSKKGTTSNNKKKAPTVKVEAAATTSKRPPNFSSDEDLYISKAFVNVSTDPTVGTGQKGKDFWDRVQVKFREIQAEEAEVQVINYTRTATAIMNRWQRHILPAMNKYNKFYKEHKDLNHSGWKEEDYISAAADTYLEMIGAPFKWSHCVEVLHKMPRFHPMMAGYEDPEAPDLEEDAKGGDNGSTSSKRGHNQLGSAMGDGLERPLGSKAAKQLKKDELSFASLATTKVESMQELTASTAKLATAIETKGKHDTWMKQATFYAKLGNMTKAQEFMDKIEKDQARLEEEETKKKAAKESVENTPSSSAPLRSIDVMNNKANEAPEEDVSRTSSGAIKQKGLEYDTDDEDQEEEAHKQSEGNDNDDESSNSKLGDYFPVSKDGNNTK